METKHQRMYSTSLPVIVLLCVSRLQLTEAVAISEFSLYLDAKGTRLCAADKPSQELATSSKISCGIKCSSRESCMFFTFQTTEKKCLLYDFQPKLFYSVEGCISYSSKILSASPPGVVLLESGGNSARLNCRRSTQHVRWNFTEVGSQTPVVIVEDCLVVNGFTGWYDVDNSDFGCSLIIPNPDLSHAGKYTCEDVLSNADPATSDVSVWEFAPKCVDSNLGFPLYFGQEVTFQCSVRHKGELVPSIEWTDSNGTAVSSTTTLKNERYFNSFLTTHAFGTVVEPFKCTAKIDNASTADYKPDSRSLSCYSTPMPVKVLVPVCYDNSSDGEIVQQDYLNLTCTLTYISGNSIPSVQWYDSDENLVKNATIISTSDGITTYILIPAYYPTIRPFTFVTFSPNANSSKYTWTSKEITVLGCPRGFLHFSGVSNCYKVIFSSLTWDEANQKCQLLYPGAYMSMIGNITEQRGIRYFVDSQLNLSTDSERSCCTKGESANNLIWTSGQTLKSGTCEPFVWKPASDAAIALSYTNWSKGGSRCTPSNNKNCIGLRQNHSYTWIDIPCNHTFCALCEYGPW